EGDCGSGRWEAVGPPGVKALALGRGIRHTRVRLATRRSHPVPRKQTVPPLDADHLQPVDAPRLGKKQRPPTLTLHEILAWPDAWPKRTGLWPKKVDGAIPQAPLDSRPMRRLRVAIDVVALPELDRGQTVNQ